MNKKIIAFGASNSKRSINKTLVIFASSQLKDFEVTILDLNEFPLPVYSVDDEKEYGVPENANRFLQYIQECDGIILSLAEYNGLYTSAFKNLWDWMSRISTPKIWGDKPMFLLGTSPSKREGSYVMTVSLYLFPLFGANIISSFHLPSFNYFFRNGEIVEHSQKEKFYIELLKFQKHLTEI